MKRYELLPATLRESKKEAEQAAEDLRKHGHDVNVRSTKRLKGNNGFPYGVYIRKRWDDEDNY